MHILKIVKKQKKKFFALKILGFDLREIYIIQGTMMLIFRVRNHKL